MSEDSLGRLMGRCFGQYGNCETRYSDRVEKNGRIVENSENRDGETID